MSQPFKLLRLPTVALRNVLQFLNPIELFELSQCSRRALSIIPLSGSRNFRLEMDDFRSSIRVNGHSFLIYSNDSQLEYPLSGTRTFNEFAVKICHKSEQKLISFWDSKLVGLKTVFFHVSTVFKCPIENARFTHSIPAAFFMPIINFIISRQSEIKELFVGVKNLSDEQVTEIFNKLRVTDDLEVSHKLSVPPSFTLNSKSNVIWNSSWITSEYLNSLKLCIVIELYRSALTDSDMTTFLNNWKSGQFPNLQYLSIDSDFLSKNFTAFGLPSLRDTVNPQMYEKTILGVERYINGGVDVQRDDGVAAKICFDNEDGDLRILVL